MKDNSNSRTIESSEFINKQTVVRGFVLQPKSIIPETEKVEDVTFLDVVLCLKSGVQNFGDIMPMGGNYDLTEETMEEGLYRELVQEGHLRPFNLVRVGHQNYEFKHHKRGKIHNDTEYFVCDASPFEEPYPLSEIEDKLSIIKLTCTQLASLFQNGSIKLSHLSEDVFKIVDCLNIDPSHRESNNVKALQEDISFLHSAVYQEIFLRKAFFSKAVLRQLIILIGERNDYSTDLHDESVLLSRTTSPFQISDFYKEFVIKYKIDHELLNHALSLVNLRGKNDSMKESYYETILEVPSIIDKCTKMTRAHIKVLLENPYLEKLFSAFELFSGEIDSMLGGLDDEKLDIFDKLKFIDCLPDNKETDDILLDKIEVLFDIKKENFYESASLADSFIYKIVKESLVSKIDDSNSLNLININEAVAHANTPKALLELVLGVGEIINEYELKNDYKMVDMIRFEAVRKMMIMRFASEAIDYKRSIQNLRRIEIEKKIFSKLYGISVVKNTSYFKDRETGRYVNVLFDCPIENLPFYNEFDCDKKQERFRCIDLKGEKILSFINSRSEKDLLSIMRKMMVRFCKAESIKDLYGRYITLEKDSPISSRILTTYKRDNDTNELKKITDVCYDHEVVLNFIEELQKIGGKNLKIVNYKSTPVDGGRIDSSGLGGGSKFVQCAKFYIRYELEDSKCLYEEIMVFVPKKIEDKTLEKPEIKTAYGSCQIKIQDDELYSIKRLYTSSYKKDSTDLIEKLFPVRRYGNPIMTSYRKVKPKFKK